MFFVLLPPSYCSVWFTVNLLRHCVFHRLVATLYLCGDDSDKKNRFDQSKISYYGHQYLEELESSIF